MVDSIHPKTQSLEDAVAEASAMLGRIARKLVDLPDRVEVLSSLDGRCGKLILRVDPSDLDAVIGPGRQTENSLRVVVKAMGKKSSFKFGLKIEPETP
jgi:predicted RNA-binding protein YlqC (UPF0109 family)